MRKRIKRGPKRKAPERIPPILLEGDATANPVLPLAGGPGARYALSLPGEAGASPQARLTTELPESYGTGRLFLTARDPHWLFASWDLSHEQQESCNRRSRAGHLSLRAHIEVVEAPAAAEAEVHPESRNWFLFVPKAETSYVATLGFYDQNNEWHTVASSRPTFTPPDMPAEEAATQFITIPAEVPFQRLIEVVEEFVSENVPLVEAISRAQEETAVNPEEIVQEADSLPERLDRGEPPAANHSRREHDKRELLHRLRVVESSPPKRAWTPARAAELAKLVRLDSLRRVWMGSVEITELIRRRLEKDISSIAAAELARGAELAEIPGGVGAAPAVSSPLGGLPQQGRKFWFNVNAELIIYGATEPGAQVTIAGRTINLRTDGSFSYRFALPDGRYELPVVAVSSDKEEGRMAGLSFSRTTEYQGHVPPHPQDPALKPPSPASI